MILVTGGTGFVGRHLVPRLRKEGVPLRIIARDPERARSFAGAGVELLQGDISDPASLRRAAAGAERIIHLVGIIQEGKDITFRSVHVEGTMNVLAAAKRAGVRQFFFQSALGTRRDAASAYHRTKWEAEELVRRSGLPWTILRPSLIYGPGDLFTMRLAEMMRMSPVLPVIGSGRSKVQPLYIDDACSCILKAVASDEFLNRTFEVGGPEQLTYEEVTRAVADAMGIRRPVLRLPFLLMRTLARTAEAVLPKPPVTTDQLLMLQEDNICGMQDIRERFGIEPVAFRDGLARFLRKA